MAKRSIEEVAKGVPVGDFFSDGPSYRYLVPPFQRDYAWKAEQVTDLFLDLHDFWEDAAPKDFYLLGQIILSPSNEKPYVTEIVDGQQRLTSLSLFFLAVRDFVKSQALDGRPLEKNRAAANIVNQVDRLLTFHAAGVQHMRILVPESGRQFYRELFDGAEIPASRATTAANIRANHRTFLALIREKFSSSPESIIAFFETVLTRVGLVQIFLDDDDVALEFFEKTNDRGVKLSASDLMKNLLFSRFPNAEYNMASRMWNDLISELNRIEKSAPRTVAFLLKALLTERTNKSVSKAKVFREWRSEIQDEDDARRFLSELKDAARFIVESQKDKNAIHEAIAPSRHLGAEQYWSVILMLRRVGDSSAKQIAEIVDARTSLSLLAAEKSQTYERFVAPWANELFWLIQEKGAEVSVDDFLALDASRNVMHSVPTLLDQLKIQLNEIRYGEQTERARLVLALAARELENVAKTDVRHHSLERFLTTTVHDIEHIVPRSEASKENFGPDIREKINHLGNLTLWSYDENRKSQDKLPAKKGRDYYRFSLLITRSLAWPSDYAAGNLLSALEKNPSIAGAAEISLNQLDSIDTSFIRARSDLYWELLKRLYTRTLRVS
jgi:hypothetical protein